jgi:hypothetical protein
MRDASLCAVLLVASMTVVSTASYPAISQTLDPVVARRVDSAVLRVLNEERAPSASIAGIRFTWSAIHYLGRCLSKKAHITSAAFGSRGEDPSILRAR